MRYWRAICPASQYNAAKWAGDGWTEVSREVQPHTAGVFVRGGSKTDKQPSSGVGIEYVNLVKPRAS